MPEAVIVSAARTPIGRANKGSLKDFRPDDLTALAVRAALDKIPALDPATIDDLILTVDELDRLPTMPIPHDSPADLRPPRIRPKSRIRWFVPVLGVVLLALAGVASLVLQKTGHGAY